MGVSSAQPGVDADLSLMDGVCRTSSDEFLAELLAWEAVGIEGTVASMNDRGGGREGRHGKEGEHTSGERLKGGGLGDLLVLCGNPPFAEQPISNALHGALRTDGRLKINFVHVDNRGRLNIGLIITTKHIKHIVIRVIPLSTFD